MKWYDINGFKVICELGKDLYQAAQLSDCLSLGDIPMEQLEAIQKLEIHFFRLYQRSPFIPTDLILGIDSKNKPIRKFRLRIVSLLMAQSVYRLKSIDAQLVIRAAMIGVEDFGQWIIASKTLKNLIREDVIDPRPFMGPDEVNLSYELMNAMTCRRHWGEMSGCHLHNLFNDVWHIEKISEERIQHAVFEAVTQNKVWSLGYYLIAIDRLAIPEGKRNEISNAFHDELQKQARDDQQDEVRYLLEEFAPIPSMDGEKN